MINNYCSYWYGIKSIICMHFSILLYSMMPDKELYYQAYRSDDCFGIIYQQLLMLAFVYCY